MDDQQGLQLPLRLSLATGEFEVVEEVVEGASLGEKLKGTSGSWSLAGGADD